MFRAFLLTLVLAALATASAQAASSKRYPQPVVGAAVTITSHPGGCVNVGESMKVAYHLWNMTDATQTINLFFYGVGKSDGSAMKGGPLLDIDPNLNGLKPTADPTTWMHSIKLPPRWSGIDVVAINKVPPGYYPANWDSKLGPMPWPSLYIASQGFVRFSRTQVPLSVQVPYCTLNGNIPYEITPFPGG